MSVTMQHIVRRTCVIRPCTSKLCFQWARTSHIQARHLSASTSEWSGQPADAVETLIDKAGLSSTALEQLELYTWWRPSAWYRVGLEILHTHGSLSWLASIICGTVALRLALLYMPTFALKRRQRVTQLEEIMEEKTSFLQRHNPTLFLPGTTVFLTQYSGLKKMAEVSYPGWVDGGIWSFTNLSESDPYYVLPTFTAASVLFLSQRWARLYFSKKELKLFGPQLQYLKYPAVAGTFLCASQVPAAVCLCWFTSNIVSNVNAAILSSKYLKKTEAEEVDADLARYNELLSRVKKAREERAILLAEEKQKLQKACTEESLEEIFERNVQFDDSEEKDNVFSKIWQEEVDESYAKIQRQMVAEEMRYLKKRSNRINQNFHGKFNVEKIAA